MPRGRTRLAEGPFKRLLVVEPQLGQAVDVPDDRAAGGGIVRW
jgi:hypothetical protein